MKKIKLFLLLIISINLNNNNEILAKADTISNNNLDKFSELIDKSIKTLFSRWQYHKPFLLQ